MISGEGYSSSIDLWAMGVLLYEMLVGKPPFYNTSIKETTKRIK
jgi:serine/threonine protein kinase